jgi:transposase InsO family protein
LTIKQLNEEKDYPVSAICLILNLNRSSYYKWLKRDANYQEIEDKKLIELLCILYQESNGIFGYRRMQINLKRRFGLAVNKKRIYRIMRAINMKSVIRRKRPYYIRSTPEVTAENILNRNFVSEKLNEKWLTDVTEFRCGDGSKLYLSAILDLKDKGIISYAVGRSNNNDLVFDTFDTAMQKYPNAKPLFHSDRGFQYTSKVFKTKLDKYGITQSMSRVGRCIDNGPMEAFWGTIKAEMYYLQKFYDCDSLIAAIDDYILFYNNNRYQGKLGNLAPMEYRDILSVA